MREKKIFDINNAIRYYIPIRMIKSFGNEETEKIFHRNISRKFSLPLQHIALRKLLMLDASTGIHDLLIPPGNRLEALKGNKKGQYSIRINNQWRICFVWRDGDAYQVEIVDYH